MALLDIVVTRMQDRDDKALEAEIRFPTTTLSPTLQLLRQKLTSGGFSLVLEQPEKPTTSYSYAVVLYQNSVRTALSALNIVLASLSTTVQGFPLPVMLGCVNMLRNLNNRWKSNEPAVLVDGM